MPCHSREAWFHLSNGRPWTALFGDLYPIATAVAVPVAQMGSVRHGHFAATSNVKSVLLFVVIRIGDGSSPMAGELHFPRYGGREMQIVNMMTPDPVTIGPLETLSKAKMMMDAGRFRRLPVTEDGQLVGILTERDLKQHTGALASTRVNAAMRTQLVTVTPYDTVEEAAQLMLNYKVGGLPIVANSKLVGIVTTTDLLKAFLRVVAGANQIMNP
jgi:acetoin utilization protein AcuB